MLLSKYYSNVCIHTYTTVIVVDIVIVIIILLLLYYYILFSFVVYTL